jgi:hypothetical protein
MERVERVEDLDVRAFCAQGIVGASGCIPTSTVSFPPADSPRTIVAGFARAIPSSYP